MKKQSWADQMTKAVAFLESFEKEHGKKELDRRIKEVDKKYPHRKPTARQLVQKSIQKHIQL